MGEFSFNRFIAGIVYSKTKPSPEAEYNSDRSSGSQIISASDLPVLL